jgi:hypothetical protein
VEAGDRTRPCVITFFPGQPKPWSIAPADRHRASPAMFPDEVGVLDFLLVHGIAPGAAFMAIKRAIDSGSCRIELSAGKRPSGKVAVRRSSPPPGRSRQ